MLKHLPSLFKINLPFSEILISPKQIPCIPSTKSDILPIPVTGKDPMRGDIPPPSFSKPWVDFNLINRFGTSLAYTIRSRPALIRLGSHIFPIIHSKKRKTNIGDLTQCIVTFILWFPFTPFTSPSNSDIPPANHGCPTYATGTEPISKNLRHPSIPHLFFEQFSRHFNRWPLLIHHGPRTICRGGSNLPTNGKAERLVLHRQEFALLGIARKDRPRKQPPGFLFLLHGDEVGTLKRNNHVFPSTTFTRQMSALWL
ncbi:hypothetical protein NPIL_350951 [Nephila pilipes]|uniref:Uncharacterized protein n=1 Tax=Nephila pilipes TaxID=299642 RepID=A0A8X6JEE7_NEPPI|nr:hypothetical protein NPIL_350951 [Nephila pilipes]